MVGDEMLVLFFFYLGKELRDLKAKQGDDSSIDGIN